MGRLSTAYNRSVRANSELVPKVDDALIEAGRKIAERVDEAIETGEGQEVTKALYLLPHLMNVLREMHATPESRFKGELKGAAPAKGSGKSGGAESDDGDSGTGSALGALRGIQGGKAS